jgi:choline-sulfatase
VSARKPDAATPGWRAWPSRLALSMLGGSLAAVAAAAVDARFALANLPDAARAPGFLALLLADIGLLAPVALVVAFGFGCAALLVHPREAPRARALRAWFAPDEAQDRIRRGVIAPLSVVGVAAWIVLCSNAARTIMARQEVARASGAGIAAAAVLCASAIAAVVIVLTAGLVQLAGQRKLARLQPALTLPLAFAAFAAVIGAGVAAGTTSGDGGMLGIFGVLKRPELDLKAPGLLLAVGLVAWIAPSALRRLWAPAALVVALLPLGLTARAARALDDDAKSGAALEGSAPLGRPLLRLARRVTDRDHDGASRYFGGGDCDDRNPEINPMASDVPNNGVDEDCSGADLVVQNVASEQPKVQEPTDAKGRIPDDLNVLLIIVDTLRADVGYAGNPRPVTPSLDKLAAKSIVFDTAYSLATYTGKSIGPLMSGKYPSETNRGWSHYNSYPKTDRMVQERLKAAGVRTMAIHSHWYFKGWSGMGRGFDVLDFSASPPGGVDATEDATTAADRVSDAAIKVLSKPENTAKRFFAWVHYFDPHAEYVHHKGTEEFGNKMRDKYDHEVRFTDDNLGRLIEFVQSQPWGSKTAIIVNSDHGEAFGEHGMIRHGFEVWEELCRVPLVMYIPGLPPKHIKARRSAIDVTPTILDLFGVRVESPKDKYDFVSGVSLLPDALLAEGQHPPARDVLVDMPAGPNNDERRAFIHADKKLTISNGVRYQLFDLAQDPGEKTDLSDDKALLKAARADYDAFRVKLREIKVKRPEDE